LTQLLSSLAPAQRSKRWRLALIVAALVAAQVIGTTLIFGAKNSYAWFGTGHCTMPAGFNPGAKCLAADTVSGKEIAQQPFKGEIIFPKGTTTITDHMLYNGTNHVAGTYQLQLLEDEGGALNVYQTIDYTVDNNGVTNPASFTLNANVLKKAFVEHPVGSGGGLIGYFLFMSNTNIPANATCQNTVSYSGAAGALGSGTSAANVLCGPPTQVPSTGALSGHIYDCTSGTAGPADVLKGTIAVTAGPVTKPAAQNGISYSPVASGDYTEVATPPAAYHFVYNCGTGSTGTETQATFAGIHVPVGGEGVGKFYVVHDSGTIIGHIYDCTGGTANLLGDINGGNIAVESSNGTPLPGKSGANPITYQVPAGDYKELATAPSSYHLVACEGASDSNTQSVLVPANGVGEAKFYVARDTGDLAAHIYDCSNGTATTTEVGGGTVAASGPSTVASQANPLSPKAVDAGDYNVSATNPTDYHFVYSCVGDTKGSHGTANAAGEKVNVPANGHGVAIFYVSRDQGQLAGHIYDCTSGATTTEVPGGILAAGGPETVASQSNPMAPTTVITGDYDVTGGLPAGYHWIACNGTSGSDTISVNVPSGGVGTAILYAAKDSTVVVTPTPSPNAVQRVLGAATTAPNTGNGGLFQAVLLSLVLMVIGGVTLALTRSRKRGEVKA
jgi:hypothetical protein